MLSHEAFELTFSVGLSPLMAILLFFDLVLPNCFLTHPSGMHILVHARLIESKGHAELTLLIKRLFSKIKMDGNLDASDWLDTLIEMCLTDGQVCTEE
ncbi:MAG: hypothetical protein ACJAXN_001318 [Psychromonas sp.]|jgi:hypothetical protein